ncbi:MAG: hypothetical protein HYS33_06395 [Acidobacteria bacterium]|nr:hypothetical protein [Acidobacteriota bacterium]
MSRKLVLLGVVLLVFGCMAWAGGSKSWTGVVSDSHCGAKHAAASDAAAGCVAKCDGGGAAYVLVSDGKVYKLDNQEGFKEFAGKSVKVTGVMDGDSIRVESVEAAS